MGRGGQGQTIIGGPGYSIEVHEYFIHKVKYKNKLSECGHKKNQARSRKT